MQFSYYIFPPSYVNATVQSIEENLKELNNVVIKKKDAYDYFFYDNSLLEQVVMSIGVSFIQIIYGQLSDKQFSITVLPVLMSKIQMSKRNFDDQTSLDTALPESINALWGICFNPATSHCLTCTNDYINFRFNSVKNIINGTNFWALKGFIFKKLIFCVDVAQLVRSISTKDFNKIMDHLINLDKYNMQWTKGRFSVSITKKFALDISDESSTVKQNSRLSNYRYFIIPNGIGGQYCYYHIKTGNFRVHFYPDDQNHQIYVAYIGTHLPLK